MKERIATVILYSLILVPMVVAAFIVGPPMGIAMVISMIILSTKKRIMI